MPFLTESMAEMAIDLVTPFIQRLVEEGVVKRSQMHIIVAQLDDPTHPTEFTVMAEKSLEREKWEDAHYDQIALLKTAITARTGLSSREVQFLHPELLEDTDTIYWGNVIVGNIIVSCSGAQPWMDEAISNAIAGMCKALVHSTTEARRSPEDSFIFVK